MIAEYFLQHDLVYSIINCGLFIQQRSESQMWRLIVKIVLLAFIGITAYFSISSLAVSVPAAYSLRQQAGKGVAEHRRLANSDGVMGQGVSNSTGVRIRRAAGGSEISPLSSSESPNATRLALQEEEANKDNSENPSSTMASGYHDGEQTITPTPPSIPESSNGTVTENYNASTADAGEEASKANSGDSSTSPASSDAAIKCPSGKAEMTKCFKEKLKELEPQESYPGDIENAEDFYEYTLAKGIIDIVSKIVDNDKYELKWDESMVLENFFVGDAWYEETIWVQGVDLFNKLRSDPGSKKAIEEWKKGIVVESFVERLKELGIGINFLSDSKGKPFISPMLISLISRIVDYNNEWRLDANDIIKINYFLGVKKERWGDVLIENVKKISSSSGGVVTRTMKECCWDRRPEKKDACVKEHQALRNDEGGVEQARAHLQALGDLAAAKERLKGFYREKWEDGYERFFDAPQQSYRSIKERLKEVESVVKDVDELSGEVRQAIGNIARNGSKTDWYDNIMASGTFNEGKQMLSLAELHLKLIRVITYFKKELWGFRIPDRFFDVKDLEFYSTGVKLRRILIIVAVLDRITCCEVGADQDKFNKTMAMISGREYGEDTNEVKKLISGIVSDNLDYAKSKIGRLREEIEGKYKELKDEESQDKSAESKETSSLLLYTFQPEFFPCHPVKLPSFFCELFMECFKLSHEYGSEDDEWAYRLVLARKFRDLEGKVGRLTANATSGGC
jgi:hypothetical protein